MAQGRVPDPLWQHRSALQIADGTLCLQPSPTPGPVGVDAAGLTAISRMSAPAKIGAAIMHARHDLTPEVGDKLLALVTPEALEIIAGTVVLWAAGHLFGVSEVVDLVLLGVGVYALGSEALTGGRELADFAKLALNAKTSSDLDMAGQHFARFVATVGVDGAIAILLRKTVGKKSSAKASVAEKPTLRPDVTVTGAGRSGQKVKYLFGPPNSALKSEKAGRVFVTDSQGRVILDIEADRVKPVTPNLGFGDKRPPTQEELDLIRQLWGK